MMARGAGLRQRLNSRQLELGDHDRGDDRGVTDGWVPQADLSEPLCRHRDAASLASEAEAGGARPAGAASRAVQWRALSRGPLTRPLPRRGRGGSSQERARDELGPLPGNSLLLYLLI
jgi:hypothetical protein